MNRKQEQDRRAARRFKAARVGRITAPAFIPPSVGPTAPEQYRAAPAQAYKPTHGGRHG